LIIGLFAGLAGAAELAKDQSLSIAFDAGDLKASTLTARATADRAIVDMMFNGLVRYPPGNQVKLEPDIAESWSVAPDKKAWTFKPARASSSIRSRQPQRYELTSEDVVFPEARRQQGHLGLRRRLHRITFEAGDRSRSRSQSTSPSPIPVPGQVRQLCRRIHRFQKAIEAKGEDWFKTNPVGTGPFKFESYEPRQKVVFAGNPKYFRGAPILKKVTARFMPDVSSREFGLQTGELHIIEGLKEDKWIEKVATFKDVKAPTFGPCETQMLYFNMSIPPFNDLRVRKAFSYALSRDVIANFMGKSLAVPIYSPALAPPALGALTKDEALKAGVVYDNNIEQAKAARRGRLPQRFQDRGHHQRDVQQLPEADGGDPGPGAQGRHRHAAGRGHASFHSKIRENASPIVYYASWRPNEDVFLTQFYYSDSVVQKGKKPITNFSHYGLADANADGKTDSVDQLIVKARWELNAQKQEVLWKEAQIQL
jgi:peptide/nickel transport system substrate-binding protein